MQEKQREKLDKHEIEPDRELLLWEKWIQIRKEEMTKLGEFTQRPPVDLAMNLLEKKRVDQERKITLEHAQVEKKPTVRGHIWEQPERLKQKCYCNPVYELHRTAVEIGRPHIIEHIGVPDFIQTTEKGLCGIPNRKTCTKLNSHYEKYRDKRENELKAKIQKIDPFRPDTSMLIIKGGKPEKPKKKLPPLPEIIITPSCDQHNCSLGSIYAMRINNTVFFKEIPGQKLTYLPSIQKEIWHEPCSSWTYYFNVPVNRAGRSKLFLQNLGTVTLRYCCKKIKKPIPYIPENMYDQVFFFNKNEDVLSPGQSRNLVFTFISDKPGMYSEFWELSFFNIYFFDTLAEKILINLFGDTVENIEYNKMIVKIIKRKVDRKAIFNIVSSIIDNAIEKAMSIEPQIYPYHHYFLEAELFLMKNPVCFYHQTEVAKMKERYTEMVPGEEWDLSIVKWREVMMEKEFDERMKYFELLKESHVDLLKPWYEGDDLLKHKCRAIKLLLGQLADKFDTEYNRIIEINANFGPEDNIADKTVSDLSVSPVISQKIRNLFYIHIYEHVATTIELCAGVLSSLDLNRWIDFDFCQ